MASPASPLAHAVGFISLAAVAAQCWDWMIAFSDEINYLWRGKFTFIKALYFSSRYGLLMLQLIDKFLYFRFQENTLDPIMCARIFVYKTIMAQVGMTLVEIILLIRVYALYNNGFRARYLLLTVFITSTALECTAIKMVIDSLLESPACVAPPMDGIVERLYGVGSGFCQFVVFVATISKLLYGRRTPLTSLMFKEGIASFILLFVLLVIVIAYEIIRNVDTTAGSDTTGFMGNAIVSWYIAILSIAGSRLILNMRTVIIKHRLRLQEYTDGYYDEESESVYLTTINE